MGEEAVCVERLEDVEMKEDEISSGIESKKQAKEVSNEDVKSEVSNPIISLKEDEYVLSCNDITSQPTQLGAENQVGSGEVISTTCSSSADTLSEEGEPGSGNITSQSLYTSKVVLEIPKHVSSTGIRKITFKFSKRREDYDAQNVTSVTEPVIDGIGQGTSCYEEYGRNMELKMSKKVVPNNYPTNVKKLLSTGILDGARVKYISFSSERELVGIVNGGGYLCGCSSCNFSKVLSAYEFEQHAGVKTKHPNNHIYLENGKPIYSIIQELKTAPLSIIDEVIKGVAGSSINEDFFQIWKANLLQNNGVASTDEKAFSNSSSMHNSLSSCPSQVLEESYYLTSNSFMTNNPIKHQDLMVLDKKKFGLKRPSSYTCSSVKQKKTSEGGTKRRDNDLHRLLFMPNGLPDGTKLAYSVKGKEILGGYKQCNGIVCSCCKREISPSQFEAHAGMAARRQPYRHIYVSGGLSLHDIAISLAKGQKLTTGTSDDMCTKCGDSGDLIFCQSCPRAFHSACLDLQCIPEGVWHCPNCNKFGHGGNSVGPIIVRLSRVVKQPEYVGGCVVCRDQDFSTGMFDDRTVIICDQCEKEFHVGCLRVNGICDLKELPEDNWFCCGDCNRIYVALQNAVSKGEQMIPFSQLNIINRKHMEKGIYVDGNPNDVQWQILMGKSRDLEHLSLLSRVTAIFRESFNPIVAKSGRDLIPVMVHGRNISGQEFGGMYCVLLILRNVVISAGLLRVFGRDVAELPLVATSREHQGKGYFQALFSCIERLLYSLNVGNLVLPAAEEAESIWIRRFGFRKMSEAQMSKYSREFQLTVFKGTSMLEKEVPQMTG